MVDGNKLSKITPKILWISRSWFWPKSPPGPFRPFSDGPIWLRRPLTIATWIISADDGEGDDCVNGRNSVAGSGAQTEGHQQGEDLGRSGEDRFLMDFDGFSGFRLGGQIAVLIDFGTFSKPKTIQKHCSTSEKPPVLIWAQMVDTIPQILPLSICSYPPFCPSVWSPGGGCGGLVEALGMDRVSIGDRSKMQSGTHQNPSKMQSRTHHNPSTMQSISHQHASKLY